MINNFKKLQKYCEDSNFQGWDPYDGLNSKIFQLLPLKNWSLARLAWIQTFKRNPINLRKLLLVPKEYNSKGLGLFLTGYCNLYRVSKSGFSEFGTSEELLLKINELALLLISMKSKGYSGACWGYNFDWQARRSFLFPKNTPTVVATTFCATALMEAYEITGNKNYLEIALSSADFVLKDLNRTACNKGFLFSYSPLKGNDTVYNASLLGSKLLSHCYHYTGKKKYAEAAKQSVLACIDGQEEDGSWVYGLLPVQNWKDSFHTGYNLDGLVAYQALTKDYTFKSYIDKGFDFYIQNFFETDGTPKYYHNKTYPIDIHCPGQLLITLSRMGKMDKYKVIADKVIGWTIDNMQDEKGFFHYQLKKGVSSKIPYMRWSNAFMFNALSYYLLENKKK